MDENKIIGTGQGASEQAYNTIRGYIIDAHRKVYTSVNSAMVNAYWNIGKEIYETCGENERAAYGEQVLQEISEKLTEEFGKGFSVPNLRKMRQFFIAFPKQSTLSSELSWSHYQLIMRVADDKARDFYTQEAVASGWSVRQLQRQINTMYYNRLLASRDKESVSEEINKTVPKPEYEKIIKDPYVLEFLNLPANEHLGILLSADKSDTLVKYTLPEDNNQIYAAKYMTYLPTEEELKRELNLDDFQKRNGI